eukprot:jgi/Mesvir1/27777/Mv07460-RA.1
MGQNNSRGRRPTPAEEAKKAEPRLHELLAGFISRSGNHMSVEELDELSSLLHMALITCIRAKERKSAWSCSVCLDKEMQVVLFPCCHACLCRECVDKLSSCPICREPILSHQKFILS